MYAREWEGGRWLLSNRQRVKMGLRFPELAPREGAEQLSRLHVLSLEKVCILLPFSLRIISRKNWSFCFFWTWHFRRFYQIIFYLVQRKVRIASILVSFSTYSVKPQFHSGPTEVGHLCKRNSLYYCVSLTLALWHTSHSPFSFMSSCSKALI